MSSLNKAQVIGRLGKDPELNKTDGGLSVVNFSVATAERYKTKEGKKGEVTDWHQIKAWDGLAENCDQYLSKGSLVYVEGKMKTNKWEDDNGATRYSTHVKAETVEFLTPKETAVTTEQ